MTEQLRIFIASSFEQRRTARRIGRALREPGWSVEIWDKAFEFSKTYIESFESVLDEVDFAVVVLTGDDAALVRRKDAVLPRDNVIFELGAFVGRIGRDRSFFFGYVKSGARIASDLSGANDVMVYPESVATSRDRPGLRAACERLKRQIREQIRRESATGTGTCAVQTQSASP